MRVYLKKNITAYSGKDTEEDVIYSAHNQGNVCIARNYTKPIVTAQQLAFKANSNNLKTIWNQTTTAYKTDLRTYAGILIENFPDKLKATCFSIFVKILYAYGKSEGMQVSAMNVTTLRSSAVKNVLSAMDNNFITKVSTETALDKDM